MIRDSRPYQICTRCLMDTSDPWISFDEHGRCNHCTDFLNNRICVANQDASDDSQILELVEHIKRKAKKLKYDCIIGLSGGVDSSYTAYLAVKYGLRVLGVHLDNGWDSPIAVKNISNIIKNLGIDYVTHVLPWNEFRQIQLAFLEASVPEAETPTDIAIAKSRFGIEFINQIPILIYLEFPRKRSDIYEVITDIYTVLEIQIKTIPFHFLYVSNMLDSRIKKKLLVESFYIDKDHPTFSPYANKAIPGLDKIDPLFGSSLYTFSK